MIDLEFGEKLVLPMSGIDLMMTGMPGMTDHPPMRMSTFKTSLSAGGKHLLATLPRRSPPAPMTRIGMSLPQTPIASRVISSSA